MSTNRITRDLFVGGPPLKIERRLGLAQPDDFGIGRRALLVVLIGWVPLLALSIAEDVLFHKGASHAFALDFGAHARFLFAAPLLILAEAWCFPTWGGVASYFIESGIVRDR